MIGTGRGSHCNGMEAMSANARMLCDVRETVWNAVNISNKGDNLAGGGRRGSLMNSPPCDHCWMHSTPSLVAFSR